MPVCGNYLFFELPKKIVLNPKDGLYYKYNEYIVRCQILNCLKRDFRSTI